MSDHEKLLWRRYSTCIIWLPLRPTPSNVSIVRSSISASMHIWEERLRVLHDLIPVAARLGCLQSEPWRQVLGLRVSSLPLCPCCVVGRLDTFQHPPKTEVVLSKAMNELSVSWQGDVVPCLLRTGSIRGRRSAKGIDR